MPPNDVSMSQAAGNRTVNDLIQNIEMEKMLEGRSVRVALGAVSALLAVFIIYRICRDNTRSSMLNYRHRHRRLSFFQGLHPAEVFPLVLGFAIFVQEVVFVTVQAITLNQFTTSNCKEPGVFVLPSIMILAILHLVFGMEMTISAMRANPFSRPKFAFRSNMIISGLLLLILLIIGQTAGFRSRSCSAGLVFMVASLRMSRAILGLLSIMTIIFLVMAGIIAHRLKHTVSIDPGVRISGSRMVYYLLLTSAIQLFIIPFFAMESQHYFTRPVAASTIAEYGIFLGGAFVALLHLFLRANAARTAIKPNHAPWHKRHRFRFFGPNDLEAVNISPPLNLVHPNYGADEKLLESNNQKTYNKLLHKSLPQTPTTFLRYPPRSTESLVKDKIWTPTPSTPQYIQGTYSQPRRRSSTRSSGRKPSYTLFPGAEEIDRPAFIHSPSGPIRTKNMKRISDIQEIIPQSSCEDLSELPHTTTTTNIITYPPRSSSLQLPRNSSLQTPQRPWLQRRPTISQSSATVPIAMRFSKVPSGIFQSRRPSSELPTAPEVPTLRISIASVSRENLGDNVVPFDDTFQSAFQDQVKDATGRDLNSFRWIDSPADEEPPSGEISAERIPTFGPRSTSLARPLMPLSPTSIQRPARSISPSIYPEEERRQSGWI